jgi:hypothetical protein
MPARERPVERGDRHEITKAHDEKGREHVSHGDAVRGDRHKVLARRANIGAQGAAHPHLPAAKDGRDDEGRNGDPEVRKAKSITIAHRKSSRRDQA